MIKRLLTGALEPILQFAHLVFAHHKEILLCCTGNVQEVTNHDNQRYKKPHWKHSYTFFLIKPNTIPKMK
jgi:hypothetical protein